MLNIFKSLWAYRGFILGSVKREFQSKYRNSLLGAAWTVLNPLAMIIVYTVIFSKIMHSRLPSGIDSEFAYSVYLCAGVLTWGLFAEIVSRAQNTFLENANLLKKLSFPRLCLPVIIVANSLLNFSIVFGLFTIFLMITGNFPGVVFISLAPVLFILIAFAIGLGISLGVLNVFFRDVGQAFGIFIQFWFWFTPIVYPITILPESVRSIIHYNPMENLIGAFQQILVARQWPEWQGLAPVTLVAILMCVLGIHLFRKHAGEIVDEL
jgi:lipopolysaccharide transport system permease protein